MIDNTLAVNRYDGDGTTVAFTYGFKILAETDLLVYVNDVLVTNYTVSGVGVDAGGTVTFTTAPSSGSDNVTLIRNVSATQETEYPEGNKFPTATVEADFDKRAMVEQQLQEQLNRSLKFARTSAFANIDVPDPVANSYIRWNSAGTGMENVANANEVAFDSGVVLVEDYGATGDGVADDTAELQAALDSGNRLIRCTAGKTYLVSYTGTKSVSGANQRYCLTIPANTWLDLNGATIKMATGSNANVIINATAGSSDTDNLRILNGTVDSDYTNQTSAATGQMAGIFLHRATNCVLDNIYLKNNREYAGRFLKSQGRFTNLYCNTSYGDGFSFGIEGSDTSVIYDSFIDNIRADACLGSYSGKQGNPILFTIQRCNVGKVSAQYSKGGIKIQDSSQDSYVHSIVEQGDTNGSTNSGVKIQGNNGGLTVRNISIGSILVTGGYGNGLYLYDCTDISIGQFVGYGNNTQSAGTDPADVYIKSTNTTRIRIGSIISRNCTQRAFTSESTGFFQIGEIISFNCNNDGTPDRAIAFTGNSGYVGIGRIIVHDTNGTSNTTNVLNVSGSGLEMHIESIYTNLDNSTSAARLTCGSGSRIFIGRFKMGTAAQEGVAALANGAAQTAVTNDSVAYFGTTSIYPIIVAVPWDATSAALGNMRCIPTIYSSGTGFTIKYASNSATGDDVYWKILGWTSLPGVLNT